MVDGAVGCGEVLLMFVVGLDQLQVLGRASEGVVCNRVLMLAVRESVLFVPQIVILDD